MALREKFGRLVLLEKTDSDPLGDEWSAARLGPSGLDRLVSVLRFSPPVSAHADATKRLVDEARLAAQVHGPALLRVLGVGRVGQSFYVSTELAEGRTLRAILARCADEGFPFAVDHALMIASRSAAGLELLHRRKDESGQALVHGLLTPGRVVVAFDGEVKLKGLGLWGALGPHQLLAPEERAYLAPEQAGGAAQPRSDVYALGLVLLEALSGQRPEGDPFEHIAAVRIASPGGDPAPLPKPLVKLLHRALARDPAARYPGTAEMRKAIDALLFSGDFTPTTFDLAFFMHTLFRDDVEADARALDAARAADYREYLSEDAQKPAAPRPAQTEPVEAAAPEAPAADAAAGAPTAVSAATVAEPARAGEAPAPPAPRQPPVPPGPDSSGARLARAARETSSRGAFGATLPRAGGRRALWVALGLIAAASLVGGAGWLYVAMQRRAAAQAAASAEQAAAQARVKELETRIAQLEKEKQEAEARAAEDARKTVEQQAAAGGKTADPAAIARAQEAARQRARVEQERRQQEELARLADARRAEEQRLAAAALATPATTPLPATTPAPTTPLLASPDTTVTPTTTTAGTASPLPASSLAAAPPGTAVPGSPAETGDPSVRPPVLVSQPKVRYPAIAIATHAEGVVELHAVVDESGNVAEVKLIRTTRKGVGFEGAAEESARGRKYRPATKDGVPVKTQVRIVVNFTIPR
jgi:TonB family protein